MQYPTIAQPEYAFAPTMMAEGGFVPAARAVQSKGRGDDTMLVHMTPGEVGGLQALAMQHGGSLSINPETGLPEAGFLKNLLPTLLGIALTPIMGPGAAAMTVGGIETVRTGDLGKGILAGLGAYGGASLGSALGSAGAAAAPTATATTTAAAAPTATAATSAPGLPTITPVAPPAAPTFGPIDTGGVPTQALAGQNVVAAPQSLTTNLTPSPAAPVGRPTFGQMGQGFKDLFTQEGAFERFVGKAGTKADEKRGIEAVKATGLGGPMGAAKTFGAMAAPAVFAAPQYAPPAKEEEEPYEGPYTPTRRTVSYPGEEQRRRTSEFMYFSPSNPVPFAEGGDVSMTAPEAQVYSQIANVQQLAGLPAIDTSRFNIIPSIPSVAERVGLVYNPIDGSYIGPGSGGGAERSYGFESLSSHIPQEGMPSQITGPQSARFYRAIPSKKYASPFFSASSAPDAHREKYEEYVPTQNVNMVNYEYDPILGGYKQIPSENMYWGGAKGGSVPQLESGGFVLTKKAVDGLGKGDNKRGQEVASRGLGAIPIKGPGTGTSDSIKTTIDGKVPARIANGEAYVPKKQVAKNGGAKKFYALMKKAERRA
jgi:hypothetical protein